MIIESRVVPRRWGGIALALLIGGLVVGCNRSGHRPQAAVPAPLPVVTTVLPMTLFTEAVGGSCVLVTQLLPPARGPHGFQARPADLAAVARARVLVRNGLGLEAFLDRMLKASQPADQLVIDASQGVATLGMAPASGHGHGRGHPQGTVNPHVWLDPRRAAQQVETIRAGLTRADPGCADGYRRRAAAFTSQLLHLDRQIEAELAPYRGQGFVAFHAVAPYFAQRYGLRAAVLVDLPESEPSPADLQRVARAVRSSRFRVLVREPQAGSRSFQSLAADLGLGLSVFDPLEVVSAEAPRSPSIYLEVMRRNAAELSRAFAAAMDRPGDPQAP